MSITFWIIYAIGYIVGYYMAKYFIKQEQGEVWGWSDVRFNIVLSVLSWCYVLIIGIIKVMSYLSPRIKFPSKPPKWL